MSELGAAPDRQLRRLRAALGTSADALVTRHARADRLMQAEVAFLGALCDAAGRSDRLIELWRELRNQALVLAADLPPSEHSITLLQARLEADQRESGEA